MTTDAIERHSFVSDEVLTLGEAASYLKLAERTIQRMIARQEIPCAKVGGQWRFMRSVLDDWLLSRMQVLPRNELAPFLEATDGIVRLGQMLDERLVVEDLLPGAPAQVLRQLIEPLLGRTVISNAERYVKLLLARERLSSTALGHGVAVPHVRRPEDNPPGTPPIVVGLCRDGVAFGAPDDQPVHFFFLLSASSELVHLRLLKRITLLFRDDSLKQSLLSQPDAASVVSKLHAAEKERFPGG
jgi:nitrogen PTS system EIIA component